jgi:hypothetical protein
MTADPTAQPDPTPAPVAVPDRQAFRLQARAHLLARLADEFPGIPFEERVALAESSANELLWAAQDYSERHAPREDAPRPEPVMAPLPSEAVREGLVRDVLKALRTAWQDDYSTRSVAEGVADAILAAGYTLPAADQPDEGTVRRAVLVAIEDDGNDPERPTHPERIAGWRACAQAVREALDSVEDEGTVRGLRAALDFKGGIISDLAATVERLEAEGTVREEIAREIQEADRKRLDRIIDRAPVDDVRHLVDIVLTQAAHIARGGTR